MMAYLLLSQKIVRIKSVAIVSAPSDLQMWSRNRPAVLNNVLVPAFGGSINEMKKRSGVYLVKKFNKNVPLFILHGQLDDKVSVESTLKMYDKCCKNGVPTRLLVLED